MASFAIILWPLFTLIIFVAIKDVKVAIIAAMLGGFLFLPSGYTINLPGLPDLDRNLVTILPIAAMLMVSRAGFGKPLPSQIVGAGLILTLLVSPIFTVLTNTDPAPRAIGPLPGISLYDAMSIIVSIIVFIIPFLFGYNHFCNQEDHRKILLGLVIAGLIYTVFILWEARMSPQLHYWTYGIRPRAFVQSIRWDGYRPHVFLQSGLWLSFFMFLVLVAAIALWRGRMLRPARRSEHPAHITQKTQPWRIPGVLVAYFSLILVICKSMGSLIYGIIMAPLLLFFSPRNHIRIAFVLAMVALFYPQLRGAKLVPTQEIVNAAAMISESRAASLDFRFRNEEMLLDRASERPLFGWGTWGRNRVYDDVTGNDISVTDGRWIIEIGSFGWIGFLSMFGLMSWPIMRLWRHAGRLRPTVVTSALALMLAVNMIELLPNSTLPPLTLLIAGAVAGYVEAGLKSTNAARRRLYAPRSATKPVMALAAARRRMR